MWGDYTSHMVSETVSKQFYSFETDILLNIYCLSFHNVIICVLLDGIFFQLNFQLLTSTG